jgi:hypothetical protein
MSSGYWFDSKIVVVPTAGIVAYPLPFPKDVTVFFTRIKEFLNSLIIAWRALFSSLTIVLRTVVVILFLLVPALLSPATGHVTTIDQIRY